MIFCPPRASRLNASEVHTFNGSRGYFHALPVAWARTLYLPAGPFALGLSALALCILLLVNFLEELLQDLPGLL
eukprot:9377447-Heterocapsa_arctica.AAC.1